MNNRNVAYPSNLLEVLERSASSPLKKGVRFFKDGQQYSYLCYQDILFQAGCLAGELRTYYEINNLERIAITLPTSPEYIVAFFGVLAAGAVPVTLPYPSRIIASQKYISRIEGATTQSKIRYIIGDEKVAEIFNNESSSANHQSIKVIPIECFQKLNVPLSKLNTSINGSFPALIQYTSGSTSAPKGVVLTHQQVIANLDAINCGLGLVSDDICCSWLPLFHDMGLIGCLLGSIYSNIDLLLMDPIEFIRDPLNWLRLFDNYKATVTAAPNSSYLRCVQKVDSAQVKSLNLSSWRIAMNGSEPVDLEILNNFCQYFRDTGFNFKAFMPVYGMAEASLAVTFPPVNREHISINLNRELLSKGVVKIASSTFEDVNINNPWRQVISVGYTVKGIEVCILSKNKDLIKKECNLGQICIKGDSVTSGYDFDQTLTENAFFNGWFCTGDVGFIYNSELYVVGRIKDIIILNGYNYYANDIESIISQISGLIPQRIMAFSLKKQGKENLVILAETSISYLEQEREKMINLVKQTLFSSLGITPYDIVFFGKGKLPKTSSGKLQRHKGAELYINYCGEQMLENMTFSMS